MEPTSNHPDDHPARPQWKVSWELVSFLTVFVPAMAIRIHYLNTLDTQFLFFKYPYFAEKLASGEPIGTRLADLSPFYLYFLSLFRWLTPFDWTSLKVIQALVGACNCWLTAALGKQVSHSRIIGIAAGLGLATYGNLIVLETTLEPTVFVICFNLLAVYGLYRYAEQVQLPGHNRTYQWLLFSALCTGLSIITKPSFLLFIPIACIWILILNRMAITRPGTIIKLVLFCAVSLGVVSGITLRNYFLLDDLILVTADAGKVFFHGNSREATVLKWAALPDQGFIEEASGEPDYAHTAFRNQASSVSGRKLLPSESSKFWTRKTLADIAAEPGRYLQRQLGKFLFFFSSYELHYIASAYQEYKASLSFPYLRFSVIIFLGTCGMLLMSREIKSLLPLYGMVCLYLCSGMIYVVQSRYRIPATPWLIIFAVLAVRQGLQLLRSRHYTLPLAALGGALFFYLSSNAYLEERIKANDRWFQATKIHYEIGAGAKFRKKQYAAAIEDATRALQLEPAFGPAYNLRGKSHAMLENYAAAVADFQRVIKLHPNSAEGYRNLGFAHLLNGDKKAAIANLKKALEHNPQDGKAATALEKLTQPQETENN